VRAGGVLAAFAAAGWLNPAHAEGAEWNKAAFDVKSIDELVKVLGGAAASASDGIDFDAPDIAENGAVVPLAVKSAVPGTESIAILIEKNPTVLAALFSIPQGTLPEVQTRVKMAETCNVFALVRAGGNNLYAVKEIKVTLGGCGG
jgi:sulfur-oxidizing protein SoxY